MMKSEARLPVRLLMNSTIAKHIFSRLFRDGISSAMNEKVIQRRTKETSVGMRSVLIVTVAIVCREATLVVHSAEGKMYPPLTNEWLQILHSKVFQPLKWVHGKLQLIDWLKTCEALTESHSLKWKAEPFKGKIYSLVL